MSERYQSWWEKASLGKIIVESAFRPRVVFRQILVAIEWGQSPLTSDLENFQTLQPKEAEKLLKQWEKVIKDRGEASQFKK